MYRPGIVRSLLIATVTVLGTSIAPAHAQTQDVWYQMLSDWPIHQCPANNCNVGQTHQGDWLHLFCLVRTSENMWYWVYNTANSHEGFIEGTAPPGPCDGDGSQPGIGNNVRLTQQDSEIIYQCPWEGCNQGQAFNAHELSAACYVRVDNTRWIMLYDHGNKHTGFIRDDRVSYEPTAFNRDCGAGRPN